MEKSIGSTHNYFCGKGEETELLTVPNRVIYLQKKTVASAANWVKDILFCLFGQEI